MPIVLAFVAVAGLAVVVLLVAEHLRQKRVWARLSPAGYQEAWVTINGRYHPSTIAVRQGLPLRLHFLRNEDTPCSERIILSGFGVNRRLPAFQETTVELVPTTVGTFLFTCQWGVYRGHLVVAPGRQKSRAGRIAAMRQRQTAAGQDKGQRGSNSCAVKAATVVDGRITKTISCKDSKDSSITSNSTGRDI